MEVYISYMQYADWTLHDLFLEIGHTLRSEHNATVHYSKDTTQYVHRFNYKLPDCEIIIYEESSDILKAISYSEFRTGLWDIFVDRNNSNDIHFIAYHIGWGIKALEANYPKTPIPFNFQFKTTTFFSFVSRLNLNYVYNKRQFISYESMKDIMFFKTSTGRGDEKYLQEENITSGPPHFLPNDEFLLNAINHKVALSIAGVGEISHRDLDFFAAGIPILRLEFVQDFFPTIVPNYHYISIDRGELPWDSHQDCKGGVEYRQRYLQRYNEIKDDYDFLTFISKNAHQYYQDNCASHSRLNMILNRLEI